MSEVSVLLLTEDSSKWASATLEQVCRRIFEFVVPQFEDGAWLSFLPANEAARREMAANLWKSRKSRKQDGILRLCKDIATHVSRLKNDGFVFCHIDGDVIWGERSENCERFEEVIRKKVREIVRGNLEKRGESEARLDHVMSRLITIAPFYSIETWLFANIEELRRLGASEAILASWEADLGLLDASIKPKGLLSISTLHYPQLARELRASVLYSLESSFCATVNRTGACGSLVVRLRAHWPPWLRARYGP